MKGRITKEGDSWVLTLPLFGFRTKPDRLTFPSHRAAIAALENGVASGTSSANFADIPFRKYRTWWREDNFPVRIDA